MDWDLNEAKKKEGRRKIKGRGIRCGEKGKREPEGLHSN